MGYAFMESEHIVSYFRIKFNFNGWKEFDGRDKYR
jgi:hypothetical protein